MTRAGEKMLTTILATTCGVLFVLAVAMQFGLGRGYHWNDADLSAGEAANSGAIDRKQWQLPPQSDFAATSQRPLFNDNRRPAPDEGAEPATDQPPPSPLNISLTGTLLVGKPESRMAMVRENGKLQTIALKEGMPLPGDQGTWTLSQVKKRSAVFKSNAGEEVEVELAVASAGQKAGPQSRAAPGGTTAAAAAAAAAANHAANPPQTGPVSSQSDELQRRIEERRKQMREAAERMKVERQGDQQQPPPPPQQQ
jgi:general secretion pathway protein N